MQIQGSTTKQHKMNRKYFNINRISKLLALSLLSFFFTFTLPVYGVEKKQETETEKVESKNPEPQLSLIDIITYATTLPKRLIELKTHVDGTVNVSKMQQKMDESSKKIDDLDWQITLAKTDPNLRYDNLVEIETKLHREKTKLERISTPLYSSLELLAQWNEEWLSEDEKINQWKSMVDDVMAIRLGIKDLKTLKNTVQTALGLIEPELNATLLASRQASELQIKVYSLSVDVRNLIVEIRESGIEQTSPYIFSSDFYSFFNKKLWSNTWQNIIVFVVQQKKIISLHKWALMATIIAILLLSVVVSQSGRFANKSTTWYPFTERPFSASTFIILSLIGFLYRFFGDLPPGWSSLIWSFIILAVIRLSRGLIDETWKKRILTQLSIFLLITLLIKMINLPLPLLYLYVFYVSAFGLFYCIVLGRKLFKKKESKLIVWEIWLTGLLFLSVLLAIIFGFSEVSFYLFESFLASVVIVLSVWMLFRLTKGIIELALHNSPADLLRRNKTVILDRLTPFIVFIFAIFLLLNLLLAWKFYLTPNDTWQGLVSFGITVGSVTITPWHVLLILIIIYGSFLLSKALQAILLQEVLPRHGAEKGVQISITRLVHYAVLLIGFILLLKALKFELTNLTILGGALGVGIGFGLQAIVNNFASGLILLFERPLKVGDTIQIGAELGEVKQLGLRATVIQTYDNAEIVVPNSDLITGQVTNWTLAERRIRIKIPVGVAYGSDVEKVLKILLTCAEVHPLVLTQPSARALFLAFGASSLDFELRVWIREFTDRRQVLSELNQDIENEFQLQGVEIPFPQTDLHIRSVDEKAAERLIGLES